VEIDNGGVAILWWVVRGMNQSREVWEGEGLGNG
jgi:hypothetical protein